MTITDKQVEAAPVSFAIMTPTGISVMGWMDYARLYESALRTVTLTEGCSYVFAYAALEAAEAARECVNPQHIAAEIVRSCAAIGIEVNSLDVLATVERALPCAAHSSAKPADYPNPGAHTPLRPAVTEQEPAAPGVDVQALNDAALEAQRQSMTVELNSLPAWMRADDSDTATAQPSADDAPRSSSNTKPCELLGMSDVDYIANDGRRNAAGGIYATSVQEFAREIQIAFAQQNSIQIQGVPETAPAPPADARDGDTALLDWIESQYKSTSVQMSGIATYVATGQALRQLRGRSFRDAIRRAMGGET